MAYSFSSGSSQPRNWTGVFCIAGKFFINWAIREAFIYGKDNINWDDCVTWYKSLLRCIDELDMEKGNMRFHESQHTRPPCSSPNPGAYPNSRPSSQLCHPAISSPVIPFSSCPQSLPASGSFPMSQLFAWGGQSIGVSASASVLPMNTPGLISFRMDWLSSGQQ